MRLVKGKDFYDSALMFGADPSVVFVRDSIVVREADKKTAFEAASGIQAPVAPRNYRKPRGATPNPWAETVLDGRETEARLRPVCAVVGAKRHDGILVEESAKWHARREGTDVPGRHVVWTLSDFEEILARYGYELTTWSRHGRGSDARSYFGGRDLVEKQREWLIENRVAVLVYGPNRIDVGSYDGHLLLADDLWTVNGDNLKLVEFQKVIDAYICNQEIAMWVGGVLPRPGPAMVEITDDRMKAHKHGMDEWSFRRTSSEKPNS